jgi:hypothetical protein
MNMIFAGTLPLLWLKNLGVAGQAYRPAASACRAPLIAAEILALEGCMA